MGILMQGRGLVHDYGKPQFSLVLPAYNPGARIETTWAEVQHALRSRHDHWEIVFVLDGCTDDSHQRLRALVGSSHERARIVAYHPNRGKGYALRRGLLEARGRFRIFTDIDLAYGMDEVLRVAQQLHAGSAVAIASRGHPDSRILIHPDLVPYVYRRGVQSQVFTRLVHWLLPLRHSDTQAGLKGMSAWVAETVIPRMQCDGFGFDCELLTACVRLGIPITEAPVTVRYDDAASTTGVRSMVRMVRELWRIRQTWPENMPKAEAPVTMIRRPAA